VLKAMSNNTQAYFESRLVKISPVRFSPMMSSSVDLLKNCE
jgi:hypothetical protein